MLVHSNLVQILRLVDFFDTACCFCAKIMGPILGPAFGLHFLGPGLEILAPGFPRSF